MYFFIILILTSTSKIYKQFKLNFYFKIYLFNRKKNVKFLNIFVF